MVGDHGTLLGKALDVLGLLLEMSKRYEKGEVRVLVTGRLKHGIKGTLHPLPEGVAPGPDDHATTDLRVFRHFGVPDDLLIPLGKILLATRGNSAFVAFAHKVSKLTAERRTGQAPRTD